MTSLLAQWKPTYPQSFGFIYGFLFELWVLNLNKEEKEEEELGLPYIQSTAVLCDMVALQNHHLQFVMIPSLAKPYMH